MKKYFKKRYVLLFLCAMYLLFAHSCMTMRTSTRKTKQYFEAKGIAFTDSVLKISDTDIHYLQTGSEKAPTLVFIHGSPGSWDAYKAYLADAELTNNFRLIAPDRPGFGKSGFRKSMTLKPQAEILHELLVKLDNGQPYTLIGHSYGGPVIAQMALEDSSFYDNLVILAGALDPDAEKPEKWRKPLTWFPLKYLVPGALKPSNDELWFLKQDLVDLKPQLGEITQNVVIIHGTNDKLVPYQNVSFMQKEFSRVKNLEIIRLENENHFIVWNREQLIKEHLMNFTQ